MRGGRDFGSRYACCLTALAIIGLGVDCRLSTSFTQGRLLITALSDLSHTLETFGLWKEGTGLGGGGTLAGLPGRPWADSPGLVSCHS